MKTTKMMKEDWDQRARSDAFHYIASWRSDWDKDSFFASGEQDYLELVAPFLELCDWQPTGKTVLELGCGTGRMTRSFAQRFEKVFAVDLSEEMLHRAQSYLPDAANIAWIQGNGVDLSCAETGTADFVFSYFVLQHLPDPPLAFRYVQEMIRVLKPGGLFLFQFNGETAPSMNWKGRAAWGLVDVPWKLGLRGTSRKIASRLGFDPELAGKSWRGASIETGRMAEVVRAAGALVNETKGEGTTRAWIGGTKSGGTKTGGTKSGGTKS
jgi:ubiquinone/menaquinone biosynthesis C-methylase UbiE